MQTCYDLVNSPDVCDKTAEKLAEEGESYTTGQIRSAVKVKLNEDSLIMDAYATAATPEAAQKILENGSKAAVLFLTTFLDDEYINQALGLGASGYILKQDCATLASSVRAVFGGQIVFGGKIVEKLPDLMNRKEKFDYDSYGITDKEKELYDLDEDINEARVVIEIVFVVLMYAFVIVNQFSICRLWFTEREGEFVVRKRCGSRSGELVGVLLRDFLRLFVWAAAIGMPVMLLLGWAMKDGAIGFSRIAFAVITVLGTAAIMFVLLTGRFFRWFRRINLGKI